MYLLECFFILFDCRLLLLYPSSFLFILIKLSRQQVLQNWSNVGFFWCIFTFWEPLFLNLKSARMLGGFFLDEGCVHVLLLQISSHSLEASSSFPSLFYFLKRMFIVMFIVLFVVYFPLTFLKVNRLLLSLTSFPLLLLLTHLLIFKVTRPAKQMWSLLLSFAFCFKELLSESLLLWLFTSSPPLLTKQLICHVNGGGRCHRICYSSLPTSFFCYLSNEGWSSPFFQLLPG